MSLLFLNQAHVTALLDPDLLIDGLSEGFRALSEGRVVAPGRTQVTNQSGYLLTMPAGLNQQLMSVKMVSVFQGNHHLDLPSHHALIVLFDSDCGRPVAIMDGARITAVRTAAASALASRWLMRPEAEVLTIIGAGVQGRAHLQMMTRIHRFSEIRIASFRPEDAEALASEDPRATVYHSLPLALERADVVCLCTSSKEPVIESAWLKAGCHVNSVGFAPPGGELPRDLLLSGRLVVESREAFEPVPVGCAELSGLNPDLGVELGDIVAGKVTGRRDDEEITVYKAMGHAMEDLIAANIVYERARAQGLGQDVEI